GMGPQRERHRLGPLDADLRGVHAGAPGEQTGGIEDELAVVTGQRIPCYELLHVVALLELGEVGVALRRHGRGVGLEDAAVLLVNASPKTPRREATVELRARELRAYLDVGRPRDSAQIIEHEGHQPRRLD